MGYLHLMTEDCYVAVDDAVFGGCPGRLRASSGWSTSSSAIWRIGISRRAPAGPTPMTCWRLRGGSTGEEFALADVDVDVLLRFLTACREATLPGRPGGNVYSIRDGRNSGYAPATINRRLAAISALVRVPGDA